VWNGHDLIPGWMLSETKFSYVCGLLVLQHCRFVIVNGIGPIKYTTEDISY